MRCFFLLLEAASKLCKYEEQFSTIKKIVSVEERESKTILKYKGIIYFVHVQRSKNKIEEIECCMRCNQRIAHDVKLLKTLANARTIHLPDDFQLPFIKEVNNSLYLIVICVDNKQYLLIKKAEELICYDFAGFLTSNKSIIIKDFAKIPSKAYKTFGNIDDIAFMPIEKFHITMLVSEYISVDEKRYLPFLRAPETFKKLLFEKPTSTFPNKKKKTGSRKPNYTDIENGLRILRTHVD